MRRLIRISRVAIGMCLLAPIAGCSLVPKAPMTERIEIRSRSSWSTTDVVVSRQGQGSFRLRTIAPPEKLGSFTITPRQFAHLTDRLEPFRRSAMIVTTANKLSFDEGTCPPGVPGEIDRETIYVSWTSDRSTEFYVGGRGCKKGSTAKQDEELGAILESLPVPRL